LNELELSFNIHNDTSESWKSIQHEIYRVVRAIAQTASVLSGSLT
jgi:N-acetylated-alpha-linked acidic dipeptidase